MKIQKTCLISEFQTSINKNNNNNQYVQCELECWAFLRLNGTDLPKRNDSSVQGLVKQDYGRKRDKDFSHGKRKLHILMTPYSRKPKCKGENNRGPLY